MSAEDEHKQHSKLLDTPEVKVTFDWLVINRLGEFGKYQRNTYILLGFPCLICAFHILSWVFLGANVNYRCQLDGEDQSSASYYELPTGHTFNNSIPWEAGPGRWSKCEKFQEVKHIGGPEPARVACDGKYVYDNSQYKTSARIDFQLICGNTYWYTVAETLFKSGILCGAIVFGALSDRFGRRPVFFFSLCLQVTFGVVAALAPNYVTFVGARFLIGMAHSGVFLVAFVLALELVGKRKRMVAGMGLQYFFTVGWVLVGVLAYAIREWRYLQLALSLPGLFFLSYYWFLPESVRWLLTNGKKEKALEILKKAAKTNGVTIPESELASLTEEKANNVESVRILEVFKYKRTLLRSLNVFFCWFVNSGVYYGLTFNSSNLGGNDYINFILSGGVEIPAYAFLLLTLNRYGRKKTLCGSMIVAGVLLIACGFVPAENTWLLVSLNMLGKLFNASGYAAIWLFSAELFPTVIRNSFMGVSSMMARVGGILADYVILLHGIWKPLPHLIFGTVSLTSGLLSLLLPETEGRRLPETMEDGENFGTAGYDSANTDTVRKDGPTQNADGVQTKEESQF